MTQPSRGKKDSLDKVLWNWLAKHPKLEVTAGAQYPWICHIRHRGPAFGMGSTPRAAVQAAKRSIEREAKEALALNKLKHKCPFGSCKACRRLLRSPK